MQTADPRWRDLLGAFPRPVLVAALTLVVLATVLDLVRRALTVRAFRTAPGARRLGAPFGWHMGMLRASYYPVAGRHLQARIVACYVAAIVLVVAAFAVLAAAVLG